MANYSVTGNPSYFNQDVTIAGNITVGQKIFGNLTGNVTGNLTGNVTGNITGNITGNTVVSGNLTANQYVVSAGSSNQFLKADGSLDSTSYLTATTVGGISENVPNTIIQRNGLGGFSAGVTTLGNTVVGGGTTQLVVQGNARITGILTIGTGSITLDGNTNNITGVSSVTDSSNGYLSLPPGAIVSIASSIAPAGYLKANGAAISRTAYSTLFSGIGTVHGAGDGSTTFNVPDLRGQFIRGWADNGSTDSGRTFGSSQADDFKSHTHTFTDYFNTTFSVFSNTGWSAGNRWAYTSANVTNAAPTTGGTETRPVNVALLYCIKY